MRVRVNRRRSHVEHQKIRCSDPRTPKRSDIVHVISDGVAIVRLCLPSSPNTRYFGCMYYNVLLICNGNTVYRLLIVL